MNQINISATSHTGKTNKMQLKIKTVHVCEDDTCMRVPDIGLLVAVDSFLRLQTLPSVLRWPRCCQQSRPVREPKLPVP